MEGDKRHGFVCVFVCVQSESGNSFQRPMRRVQESETSQDEQQGQPAVHRPTCWTALTGATQGYFERNYFWLCVRFWQNVNGASEEAQTRDHSWINRSAVLLFTKPQTA